MILDHAKIIRRSKRAWNYPQRKHHRIRNITPTSLEYRPPTQSNYYGSKN